MFTQNRPWYLFWVPKGFWITISPNVYYPDTVTDLSQWKHVVAHENVHLKQQVLHNKYIWFLKYIFIPSFRLQMEAPAMGMEAYILETLYRNNPLPDEQANAQSLADWKYLWASNAAVAQADIEAEKQLLLNNPPTFDPFDGMFSTK